MSGHVLRLLSLFSYPEGEGGRLRLYFDTPQGGGIGVVSECGKTQLQSVGFIKKKNELHDQGMGYKA